MIYVATIAFALGIVAEEICKLGWVGAVFIGVVGLAVYATLYKDKRYWAHIFILVCLAFALGVLRLSVVNTAPDDTLAEKLGSEVSLVAKIIAEPDIRDIGVRYTVAPQGSHSNILVVASRFPEFGYGDEVQLEGKLQLPQNFETDGGEEFDYISYLSKDDIHFIIYQPQISLLRKGGVGLRSSLFKIKHTFIEKIADVVPEPNSSLLGGMIFGTKQSLGDKLLEQFRNVGLIHVVVLSGYNITIIAAGAFYLTSFLGKRNLGLLLSTLCIILFSLMVGLGATVIRAGIMALIAILARFLGRPADALRWLFIAGLLMLMYNPLSLLRDPSFQLSFMATLGLVLFSPSVYIFIGSKLSFITEKFGLREIVASTLAVQLFILPLLIRMSGVVSVISFLINPILLPLVPWVMGLGALTGVLGILSTTLSWPLGIISYVLTEIIIKSVEFASSLPFSTLHIGSLPLSVVALWYGFYGWVYFRLKTK